jgi:drug/metabolite transporter (DMT)-like permease
MTVATIEPTSARPRGIMLAAVTAMVSGFAVFVNGYGVRRFDDATTYTTAKNLVAGVALVALWRLQRHRSGGPRRRAPRSVAVVAVIGGSVPFVLFFEGLQRIGSTDAAFIHKTLIVWVAILAVARLGERVGPLHVVAIASLLLGQAVLTGGVGLPDPGDGELMILIATWCWSAEVVVSKALLRTVAPLQLGTIRMAGGAVLLLAWAFVRGSFGDLLGLGASQWGWTLLTGVVLTVYVACWHHALALAPAVDVSAVLVMGAVVTAVLDGAVRGAELAPTGGLVLVTVGAVLAAVAGLTPPRRIEVHR